MTSLRQKLINEVLDEDRNINRRVVGNLQKQVSVMNDIRSPPDVADAVNTDLFLKLIDQFSDDLLVETEYIEDENLEKISPDFMLYNQIMRSRQSLLQKNSKLKSLLSSKIQTLLPLLNSIVIGMNGVVEGFILDNDLDRDPLVTKVNRQDTIMLVRLMTYNAQYNLMRNNISKEDYRPVDYEEISVEFNNLVKGYDVNVRKNITIGTMNSPLTGYNMGENKLLIDEKKRMESEFGRPLTKQEELLLSIRVGGYKQFKPFMTNKEVEDLNKPTPNPNEFKRKPGDNLDVSEHVLQEANAENAVGNEINDSSANTNEEQPVAPPAIPFVDNNNDQYNDANLVDFE